MRKTDVGRQWWMVAIVLIGGLSVWADSSPTRHTLAQGLVSLELPASWKLQQEALTPPDIAVIENEDGSIRIKLGLQPVPGTAFSEVVAAVEGAFASNFQDFQKIASATETIAGQEVFWIESTLKDSGSAWHAVAYFTKTKDEQLFSLSFRTQPGDIKRLRPQFDQFVKSVEVEGRHLVASK